MLRIKLTLFCLVAFVVLSANVQAVDIVWTATVPNSDFSLPANWQGGVFPLATQSMGINNNVPADVLSAPPHAIGELDLGHNAGIGTLNQAAYTLTANGWVIIGQGWTGAGATGGTGTLNLSGSAVFNHGPGGELHIGEGSNVGGDPTTNGYLNLSGNAVLNDTSLRNVEVGYQINGNGAIDMSGNSRFNYTSTPDSNNGWFWVGRMLGGTGTGTFLLSQAEVGSYWGQMGQIPQVRLTSTIAPLSISRAGITSVGGAARA